MTRQSKTVLSYDDWRHERMRNLVDPIINKKDNWLTIGDNSGTDAQYLFLKGVKNITSSDISIDNLSKNKKQKKYTFNIKKINAEHIEYKDNSFDFVSCKESLHHFTKPILGLYEMIRIAKQGVALIEPNDFKAIKNLSYVNQFEIVGNYVYRISAREIEKLAYSANCSQIAYKGIDDIYLKNHGRLSQKSLHPKIIFSKLLLKILDLTSKLKIREQCLVCILIFKTKQDKRTINKLKKYGYHIKNMIRNPYQNS